MSLLFYPVRIPCGKFAVSRLVRIARRSSARTFCGNANAGRDNGQLKFNMLMLWCIGHAASRIREFYVLPVGGRLVQYDRIAVNTIVADSRGEVSSCDIPFLRTCRSSVPIICV